jgi:hypothetical protein
MERILAAGSERRHQALSIQHSAFRHPAFSCQHSACEGLDPLGRAAAQECSPGRKPWVPKRKDVKPQRGERSRAYRLGGPKAHC